MNDFDWSGLFAFTKFVAGTILGDYSSGGTIPKSRDLHVIHKLYYVLKYYVLLPQELFSYTIGKQFSLEKSGPAMFIVEDSLVTPRYRTGIEAMFFFKILCELLSH